MGLSVVSQHVYTSAKPMNRPNSHTMTTEQNNALAASERVSSRATSYRDTCFVRVTPPQHCYQRLDACLLSHNPP